MFHPIGDRNIPEENAFLEDQALAMREQNPVFTDVTPFLNAQIREEFVQRLPLGALLNSLCRFLKLGLLCFQSR